MTGRIGAGEIYIALVCHCFQLLFISAPHTPVTIKNNYKLSASPQQQTRVVPDLPVVDMDQYN